MSDPIEVLPAGNETIPLEHGRPLEDERLARFKALGEWAESDQSWREFLPHVAISGRQLHVGLGAFARTRAVLASGDPSVLVSPPTPFPYGMVTVGAISWSTSDPDALPNLRRFTDSDKVFVGRFDHVATSGLTKIPAAWAWSDDEARAPKRDAKGGFVHFYLSALIPGTDTSPRFTRVSVPFSQIHWDDRLLANEVHFGFDAFAGRYLAIDVRPYGRSVVIGPAPSASVDLPAEINVRLSASWPTLPVDLQAPLSRMDTRTTSFEVMEFPLPDGTAMAQLPGTGILAAVGALEGNVGGPIGGDGSALVMGDGSAPIGGGPPFRLGLAPDGLLRTHFPHAPYAVLSANGVTLGASPLPGKPIWSAPDPDTWTINIQGYNRQHAVGDGMVIAVASVRLGTQNRLPWWAIGQPVRVADGPRFVDITIPSAQEVASGFEINFMDLLGAVNLVLHRQGEGANRVGVLPRARIA
jgi:hypothetical protein